MRRPSTQSSSITELEYFNDDDEDDKETVQSAEMDFKLRIPFEKIAKRFNLKDGDLVVF